MEQETETPVEHALEMDDDEELDAREADLGDGGRTGGTGGCGEA
jgi:hypothetical protein